MARPRRLKIGVLTDWLERAYYLVVLHGVLAAARECDASVVAFVSGLPRTNPPRYAPVHRLAGPTNVDALLCLGSTVSSLSESERSALLGSMGDAPVCLVGFEAPGASTLVVDNEHGTTEAVTHLVQVHGHRRIAFVCGNEQNAEARLRLRAYRSALEHYDIEVDERLIVPGDFTEPAGIRAAAILLDERQVRTSEVDAVIAANDLMARGLVQALAERNIAVPDDLAVVGFDDGLAAQAARVPLTTVRQPLHRLGREAVRMLAAQLEGKAPERVLLRTSLVTRRSCGCAQGIGQLTLSHQDARLRGGRSFEVAFLSRRDETLAQVKRAAIGRFEMLRTGWDDRLIRSLVEEMKGLSPGAFRREFEDLLDQVTAAHGDPAAFHQVVSALWLNLIPCVMADPALRTAVESLLDAARIAISTAVQRVHAAEYHATTMLAEDLTHQCAALCTSSSLEDVAAIIEQAFPRLGIRRVAVALYERRGQSDTVVRVLSFNGGVVRLDQLRMPDSELPNTVMPTASGAAVLVCPLYIGSDVFGIVCMELAEPSPLVLEAVRDSLSEALYGLRSRGVLRV